ncbi:MAG TPA: hypothetical protein VF791_01275 [Pyrinomonadaceae bacterium]
MEHALDLSAMRLSVGIHTDRDEGVCLLEAVAWWANEPHTHRPQCVCSVLAQLCEELNDAMPDDERSNLVPLIPRLAGSRSGTEVEWRRAFLLADYALRERHALTLEYWGYEDQALELLELAPVTDQTTAEAVAAVLARQAHSFPDKHRFWFGDQPAWTAQAALKATNPASLAATVSEMIVTGGYPWADVVALIERACAID